VRFSGLVRSLGCEDLRGLLGHKVHHAVGAYSRPLPKGLQGYLDHKKVPPP